MTTNTLFNLDVAASRELPSASAPPATEKLAIAWRPLVGGCLLQLPRIVWMAMDVILVCLGTALGERLFVWWESADAGRDSLTAVVSNTVLAAGIVCSGVIFGLYEQRTLWARSRILARCFLTVCLAMFAGLLVMHLLMYSAISRRAAACGIIFFIMTAPLARLIAHGAIRYVRRGLLVIGCGALTGQIIRSVRRGVVPGYNIVGLVLDSQDRSQHDMGDIPVVGRIADVERLCRAHRVAEVVVADHAADSPRYQRAALTCLRLGCRVTNESTFYETTYCEVPAAHITPNWFLVADLKGQREEHATLKRLFDVTVALIGALVTLPLWPLIALAIKLSDGGPAIYSQTRVGLGGHRFTLYKFRTMTQDAEALGSAWAAPNDPRVTSLGRWLRASRLDELPQLWNILKGDMSVVGPRPERPEFVGPLSSLIPFYAERHLVKPGLTGWAQINYRYGATIPDARKKLQYDLYYIKHMSFELDLVILLRTLGTFFLGAR